MLNQMQNYLWWLLLAGSVLCICQVRAKPLVSFGVGIQTENIQRPYQQPVEQAYYHNYYDIAGDSGAGYYGDNYRYRYKPNYPAQAPYTSSAPYAYPYPYPYPFASQSNRYGALDIGIGALSLTPFLL